MVVTTRSRGSVAVLAQGCRGGCCHQRAERGAQPLVAASTRSSGFALAGLDRDSGLAGIPGERVAGRVARPAVTDLREQPAAVITLSGPLNSDRKIAPSGCSRSAVADLALELLDLHVQRLDRRDQREHELPAGAQLELADAALGRAPELGEQLRRLLPAGGGLSGQKPPKAGLAGGRAGRRRPDSAPKADEMRLFKWVRPRGPAQDRASSGAAGWSRCRVPAPVLPPRGRARSALV